jgi:S-adenosylmethionine synthetase
MNSPQLMFTSESVTEGHPDKLCDQISDAVLDACLAEDPASRVACEAATKTGFVVLLGEITTNAEVDFEAITRDLILKIGYDLPEKGLDGNTCEIKIALAAQSKDIAQGVFACRETETLMPMPIYLAHMLTRRMAKVRREGVLNWMRPDGKSQVTVEYHNGQPVRVDTVLISTQHSPEVDEEQIRADVTEHVIMPVLPPDMVDADMKIFVNPTGRFVTGGPEGDSGLTGRKIIVDTYGGMSRHGGGCFSGKDPTKVDRSAAYAARWVAKHIVAAGLADRCEIQVAYAIGVAEPLSVNVETFGTGRLADEEIVRLIDENFDLRPGAIIRDLGLRSPIYLPTATYGHFGRDDLDLPWERLNRLESLQAAMEAVAEHA